MTIPYALYENKLSETDNAYAARVLCYNTVGLQDLADYIVNQGTTVRRADILAVLENLCQACESLLIMGMRIQLGGVCEMFTKIKGNFDGPTDSFDPSRHTLDVGTNAGGRIRRAVREQASLTKGETILPAPDVLQYEDLTSGEVDGLITPYGVGTINGSRLKFDPAAGDEGVFLIRGEGTALPVLLMQRNMPKQLVFQLPDLPLDEDLTLEVRTRYTTDGELRSGRLRVPLHTPAMVTA
ncbi:MAG: DUF4469 domain-containing protein [Sedimentisphaerales bacterium]|nr:DUF4469 domain-containing protein [Sedimentisphaerales bacterium]